MTTTIREYDGARSVEVTACEGMVYLDTGDRCMAFDQRILLHQMKRELGIAFVVQEDVAVELVA